MIHETMRTGFQRIVLVLLIVWLAVPFGNKARADEADDQFAVAAGYYDRHEWKLAAEEFQAFAQKFPKDSRSNRAVFYLAEALLQSGKFADARRQFQQYVGRDPAGEHVAAATFGAGESAYLADDFVAAAPDLVQFLKKYPDDPLGALALPYLGNIALTNNDATAAAGYFRDALKRFPAGRLQDHCRLGLARASERLHQPEEAERLYSAVAGNTAGPLADEAQFQLGALRYISGRYEQAIESFQAFDKQFAKSPWRFNAQLGRGLALIRLHRPNDAVEYLDAVLAAKAINPELWEQAQSGKVQAALQWKDYEAVDRNVAAFEKQYSKSALLGNVRRMHARSLAERKKYAEAATLLEALLAAAPAGRLEPSDLETRYLLAVSYEGLKRYPEALAMLLPVVDNAKGPLKADAQSVHGSLLLALKKYADAVGPLEAFLASKPAGDAEVRAVGQLTICYARTGRLDQAKQLYAALIEKHPGHPLLAPATEQLVEAAFDADDTAWATKLSGKLAFASDQPEYELKGKLNLAWSQYKSGKLAEAAATFGEVLEQNPPEPIAAEAAAARGQIFDELKMPDQAMLMYRLVISQYPKSKQRCDVLLAAARLHERLKQNAPAAADYALLAKDYPQFAKLDAVLYEWAWTLQACGNKTKSQNLFERLRLDYPGSRFWADATYRLAERMMEAKDYDVALRLADEVVNKAWDWQSLSSGPNTHEVVPVGSKPAVSPQPITAPESAALQVDAKVLQYVMFLRGRIFAAKSEWTKSREAFEQLLLAYPDTPRRLAAEFWVAESYYRQNDFSVAADRFKLLADETHDNRESWVAMIPLRRAQILARQNQWEDAYAIAVKIENDHPQFEQQYEVDYLLGRCLANRADFEAARQAYNKAIHSAAGDKTETAAMAQWMIGETYFHQKNYQAALKAYLQLEILYAYPTWQSVALLQAGKCRERLGEISEATQLYQKILKAYADTAAAKEASQQLAKLQKINR